MNYCIQINIKNYNAASLTTANSLVFHVILDYERHNESIIGRDVNY